MIKKIKRLLLNIKLWLPILMSDEQWDNRYLHKVIYHKLSLMKDFYNSDEPMSDKEHTESIVREIDSILEILNRVIDDDYIEFTEGMKPDVVFHKEEDDYEFYTSKVVYHDEFDKEKVDEVYRKSERDKEEDLKKVYKNIGENSENWWD